MKIKTKIKKTFAFIIALIIIMPALINLSPAGKVSAVNYLTVEYKASNANFAEAYGANDTNVMELTITGDGQLTAADCAFINSLNVRYLNLGEANFENNKIPDGAFGMSALSGINLPLSLTEIGKDAFRNCGALKSVGTNPNLKIIGDGAFYNSALENIVIPDSVTKIGAEAFAKCESLISVIALNPDGSKYNAAGSAFSGVSSKCVLVTRAGSTGFDGAAFSSIPNKTEWILYSLPGSGMVAAGTDYQMTADVTDVKNNKASYKWYRDGFEIYNMTGDTLILKNITPEYAGRYTVEITLNNIKAMFSSIISVGGTTTGRTTVESKNTAPDHNVSQITTPEKTKYDVIKVIDSKGKDLTAAIDIPDVKNTQTIQLDVPKQPNQYDEYAYVIYAKKLNELYNANKTGIFKINLNNLDNNNGAYINVPFNIINSLKNTDLNRDNQLRMSIRKTGNIQYAVYFAVTDETGTVLYDFKDTNSLPGVYMYLPMPVLPQSKYIVQIDDAMYSYPVPSAVTAGSLNKFKIQNNLLYSVQPLKTSNFTDIANHWGEADIKTSAGSYIVEGFPDGTYRPDANLTRAEFTTMLIRALYYNMSRDEAVFAGPVKPNVYSDIKSGEWYQTNIKYADIMGLTGFITGTEFKPNQKITREEMAYMINKAVKYAGINTKKAEEKALNYTDLNDIDAKYAADVKICTNLNLLQGSGGYFKPKDVLTRAEAATVLNRLLNLMSENV